MIIRIPAKIISLLTFPGIIVHEFAHKFFCQITDTKVLSVCYFQLKTPPGYVIHEMPRSIKAHLLISLGPLLINTLVAVIVGCIVHSGNSDFTNLLLAEQILMWFGFSVAIHAFPSSTDAKNVKKALFPQGLSLIQRLARGVIFLIIEFIAFVGGESGIGVWIGILYGMVTTMTLPPMIFSALK